MGDIVRLKKNNKKNIPSNNTFLTFIDYFCNKGLFNEGLFCLSTIPMLSHKQNFNQIKIQKRNVLTNRKAYQSLSNFNKIKLWETNKDQ